MFGDDDSLNLISALVDLGVLAEPSIKSTKPVIVRRFVHWVHTIKGSSPEL